MDISLIVNCHKERLLLYISLRSAKTACDYAESKGLKTEIIVVLDSPDQETEKLLNDFKTNSFLKLDSVHTIHLQSLGGARNFGVSKASGKYIAFLDADDLFSENWLHEAFIRAEQNENSIIHPELNVFFGKQNYWWRHLEQTSEDFDPEALFYFNYWTALAFCRRATLLKIPYHSHQLQSGYSFEDWHWNCETIEAGLTHLVAPRTTHFVRLKDSGSLNEESAKNFAIIPFTKFYDRFASKKLNVLELTPKRKSRMQKLFSNYVEKSIKLWTEALRFSLWRPIEKTAEKLIRVGTQMLFRFGLCSNNESTNLEKSFVRSGLPLWTRNQLQTVAEIEPQLGPSKSFFEKMKFKNYQPTLNRRAQFFKICVNKIHLDKHNFEQIFVLESSKNAEIQAHIKLINHSTDQSNTSTLVISTDPSESISNNDSLGALTLLNIGQLLSGYDLDDGDKEFILARLLIQIRPKSILLVDSDFGWSVLNKFGKQLAQYSKLSVSFISLKQKGLKSENNSLINYIPKLYPLLDEIYVSNSADKNYLLESYGCHSDFIKIGRQ